MAKKRVVQLGHSEVDLSQVVRDLRGVEDMVVGLVENDWSENRYVQFDLKLTPFADAADIADWDRVLLYRHPPLYTDLQDICPDCQYGPCDLRRGKGKCGLEFEAYQAKLSLRDAARGCMSQMMASRQLVNYALKVFGPDHPVDMGGPLSYMGDLAPSLGIITGIYATRLSDLDRALCYGEDQLNKLLLAAQTGVATVEEFEGMTFHAGSVLYMAMDVAEMAKISCFGFVSAASRKMEDLIDYPPVSVWGGLGSVEPGKPVVAFVGDDFLPGWAAVNYIKENALTDKIEVCGIGPAGDDIARFYDRCRIIGPMTRATKLIRSGFADVIVSGVACVNLDVVGAAKRVESKVILAHPLGSPGLKDRTDDPVDDIMKALLGGEEGVVIRDVEKAGEVAVRVAQGVKRKGGYVLPGGKVKEEARKCLPDCDLCFAACPNSLLLNQAVKKAAKEGVAALWEVEKGCYFCGRCQEACPANIPLLDLIVAAQDSKIKEDRFVMRAGRGPVPDCEGRALTFALIYGNCPGTVFIQGCGDAKTWEDIGWITNEFLFRNCVVMTAGCGAAELARHFDQEEGKYLFQRFGAEWQSRMLINAGGCSAHGHMMDGTLRAARLAAAISHYANYAETADYNYPRACLFIIIWGALPERAYAMAAGYARNGMPVVVGPASGLGWKRFLLGNKYDRSKWWMYDGFDGSKKEVEPAPKHLIIPVETREEAITIGSSFFCRPTELRDMRNADIETYVDLHETHFGNTPDDWHLFLRTDSELPPRQKVKLLEELAERHGWEIDRMRVARPKHPNGKLMTVREYVESYSIQQGRYSTLLPRLITKEARQGAQK